MKNFKSYNEFIEYLKSNEIDVSDKETYNHSGIPKTEKDYISVEWSTGGMMGGSCWGDEPYAYTNNDYDDELYALDDILELVYPECTFLRYKKIKRLIKKDTSTCNDYYGNYTDYVVKYLILEDLYNLLKSLD